MCENRKTIYFKEQEKEMIEFLKTTKEYYKNSDSEIIRKTIKFCFDNLYEKTLKEKAERIKKQQLIEKYGSEEELKMIAKLDWVNDNDI